MQPLKFETTISKGKSLYSNLTWRISQVGIFAFILVAFFSCQQREQNIQFTETEGVVHATTQHYSLEIEDNTMQVKLPNGEEASMQFSSALTKVESSSENDFRFRNQEDNYEFRLYSKDEKKAAYDLVFEPGSNPEAVRFQLTGDGIARISQEGELIVALKEGLIKHSKPYTFQEIDGQRKEISSRYLLDGDQFGFELGQYDPSYAVVVDPELEFMPAPGDKFEVSIVRTSSSPAETGTNVEYTIFYSTVSNTGAFQNATIDVTFASENIDFVSFTGTTDVASTTPNNDLNSGGEAPRHLRLI